jgi:hypothetical protein
MELFCSRGGQTRTVDLFPSHDGGQTRTVDLFSSHGGGQTEEPWNCSVAALEVVCAVLSDFIF